MTIDLSGNKDVNNLDKIKNVGSVTYKNGGISDLSIFREKLWKTVYFFEKH